jgi:hypothetical protein
MSTRSQQAKIAQAAAVAAATAAKSKANNKGKRAVPAQSDGIGALNEIDSNSAPASKKSKGVFLTFFADYLSTRNLLRRDDCRYCASFPRTPSE